jgi:hypothetical protein
MVVKIQIYGILKVECKMKKVCKRSQGFLLWQEADHTIIYMEVNGTPKPLFVEHPKKPWQ